VSSDAVVVCISTALVLCLKRKGITAEPKSGRPTYEDYSTVEPRFTNSFHHGQIFRTKNVTGDERCLE
jgi:hypothetical protein